MEKALYIGDMHATVSELEDCHAVINLAFQEAQQHEVDTVVFLGDQYNNHDTMSVRVMNFWDKWFRKFVDGGFEVMGIVGNHDQAGPGLERLHAMRAHRSITVVDEPTYCGPVLMVPYYHTQEAFQEAIQEACRVNPDQHTLVCHATFQGAQYENGMYAPDGFDTKLVERFKTVISGHIHTPQAFGNVHYLGAPRWRTLSDANIARNIVLVEHDDTGSRFIQQIPTGPVARRIWAFEDRFDAPYDADKTPGVDFAKDDVRIDVYGPKEHVREREKELRALGARTRPFPDRERRASVKESDGVPQAFGKFLDVFKPPHGTPAQTLRKKIDDRLAAIPD